MLKKKQSVFRIRYEWVKLSKNDLEQMKTIINGLKGTYTVKTLGDGKGAVTVMARNTVKLLSIKFLKTYGNFN